MRPYYIFTTHYNTSAGVKVLHKLCHELNVLGYQAFIVLTHFSYRKPLTLKSTLTPILTLEILNQHIRAGYEPIGVYHELIEGNKFGLPFIARYMLQFETKEKINTYLENEALFCYSKYLMEKMPTPNLENILFIPVANEALFNLENVSQERKGSCFYASKFKKRGGILNEEINNKTSVEILRYGSKAPPQAEVAKIFKECEIFYSYEDSTLAIEAVLCGCPAIFIPNNIFSDLHLARHEVEIDGYGLNTSPEEIERAKKTVAKGRENYTHINHLFFKQLENFARQTQGIQNSLPPRYDLLRKHLKKFKYKFFIRKVVQYFLQNKQRFKF